MIEVGLDISVEYVSPASLDLTSAVYRVIFKSPVLIRWNGRETSFSIGAQIGGFNGRTSTFQFCVTSIDLAVAAMRAGVNSLVIPDLTKYIEGEVAKKIVEQQCAVILG